MSYRNNDSGCTSIFVLIVVAATVIFFVIKGIVGIVDNINRHPSSSHSTITSTKNDHIWGEHGIDPVLRTSTGGIYQDPDHPDEYFDVRTTCSTCGGTGKVTSYKEGKGLVQEKCKDCYGTGHKRRPISQMPKGTVPDEKID